MTDRKFCDDCDKELTEVKFNHVRIVTGKYTASHQRDGIDLDLTLDKELCDSCLRKLKKRIKQ